MLKKLLSAVMAVSMVFGIVSSAAAAPGGNDFQQAFDFMKDLGCVQGYTDGQAHLDDTLTRAQAVTILVNCTGNAANAKILAGAPVFPDSGSHWASGAIAVAKNMGWVNGFPDGQFHPDEKVTYGQLVQMLDNALGLQTNAALGWPERAIKAAVDAGFLSADANLLAYADGFAPRGAAFFYANTAFMTVPLASGKTVYQSYLKPSALTVDATASASTTTDKTVAISGTAKGASAVTVDGIAATLNADGSFTADAALKVGTNEIKVVATDVVNNSSTKTVTVTRTNTAADKITVDSDSLEVEAGGTATVKVSVLDVNGEKIDNATVTGEVSDNLGTFDGATGTFTAAGKAGTGTLTLSTGTLTQVVNVTVKSGALDHITVSPATVSVQSGNTQQFSAKGFDKGGNEVALTGVTWKSSSGVMDASTGVFAGTASGNVTVTATANGVSGTSAATVYGVATALKAEIPSDLIANDSHISTVSVKVVDASGSVVGTATNTVNVTIGANMYFVDADDNAIGQSTSAKAVNGVATFRIASAAMAATSASLSATSGSLTGAIATISAAAPTIAGVNLSTSPAGATFEASGSVNVLAKVVDTEGANVKAPTTINITVANSATTIGVLSGSTLTIPQNSLASAPLTLSFMGQQGTVTISGTATGYTVNPVTLATKLAGTATQLVMTTAPSDVAANGTFTVKYALQDQYGSIKTTATLAGSNNVTVTAESSDGTVTANGVTAISGGIVTATFAGMTHADTYTFKASATNLGGNASVKITSPADATAKVTPGAAYKVANLSVNGSTAFPYYLVANGTQTATLSAEIQDQYGNVVPNAANEVTFARAQAASYFTSLPASMKATPVNGVASITLTSGINDSGVLTDSFSATAAGSAANTSLVQHVSATGASVGTQIVGLPANLALGTAPGAKTAGADFKVSYKVVDASPVPRFVSTENGRPVTLTVYDEDNNNAVVTSQTVNTVNGTATFVLNLTTASSYKYEAASVFGATTKKVSYTGQAINAAAPAKVVVKPVLTSVEGGSFTAVGVGVVDAYGNARTVDPTHDAVSGFNFATNGLAAFTGGNARTADNQWLTYNGASTSADLYARNLNESIVLGDVDGVATVTPFGGTAVTNLPVETSTVSSYVAGNASKLALKDATVSVDAVSGSATIKVGVYDGLGNLKSSFGPGNLASIGLGLTVVSAPTGTTPVIGGTVLANGVITVTMNGLTKAGTYVFDFTSSGGLLKAAGVAQSVIAGTATKVTASAPASMVADNSSVQILTFKVTDAAGQAVTNYSGSATMDFTLKAGSVGVTLLSDSAPIVNGVAQVQVKATNTAGTATVVPALHTNDSTITVSSAVGSEAVVAVKTGAPSLANSSISVSGGNVYLVLRDANNNGITSTNTSLGDLEVSADDDGDLDDVGNGVWTIAKNANTEVGVYDDGDLIFTIAIP